MRDSWGNVPALTIFGKEITAFACLVVIGMAIGLMMALQRAEKNGVRKDSVLWFAIIGIPLGTFMAHLVYCQYYFDGLAKMELGCLLHLDTGGFTMIGAIVGIGLSLVLCSFICQEKLIPLADTLLPGLLLVLAMERFGEQFTENGIGIEITENWPILPLLVRTGPYENMQTLAVNLLEGITALAVAIAVQRRERPAGQVAGAGMILVFAAQMVWESIRRDDRMMLDMASMLQVACGGMLLILFAVCLFYRNASWQRSVFRLICLLISLGIFILMQFCMDGKIIPELSFEACFALSCASAMLTAALCIRELKRATFAYSYTHKADRIEMLPTKSQIQPGLPA